VQGQLVDAQLDTGMSTGRALISAHFQVMRSGQTVFDKTLKDDHTWDSSFIGAVANPRALNEYQAGYVSLHANDCIMTDTLIVGAGNRLTRSVFVAHGLGLALESQRT
jgi:hypothetical protein